VFVPQCVYLSDVVSCYDTGCVVLNQWHCLFDVCGSVHHSTIHTEISNKMQQCIKIYYSMFM